LINKTESAGLHGTKLASYSNGRAEESPSKKGVFFSYLIKRRMIINQFLGLAIRYFQRWIPNARFLADFLRNNNGGALLICLPGQDHIVYLMN
jgi:hypothetical protein